MSQRSAEVLILAGGASMRMGSPKALLHFSAQASPTMPSPTMPSPTMPETFLDHLLAVYRAAGVERATVVWAESARRDAQVLHAIAHPRTISLKTRHVFHEDPSADRLASVLFGLRRADGSSKVFLQDVDRPFVTTDAIRSLLMCANATDGGYAAPDVFGHAGHPLLLSPEVTHALLDEHKPAQLSSDEHSMTPVMTLRDLLRPFPGTLVPVGSMEEAFFLAININTPAEYRQYFPSVGTGVRNPQMGAESTVSSPTVPAPPATRNQHHAAHAG